MVWNSPGNSELSGIPGMNSITKEPYIPQRILLILSLRNLFFTELFSLRHGVILFPVYTNTDNITAVIVIDFDDSRISDLPEP